MSHRGLLARLGAGGARKGLGLLPETRVVITLAGSVLSLVYGDPFPLGVLFVATALYLLCEVRLKAVAAVYLIAAAMAAVAMLCVELLIHAVPAMRAQSPILALLPFLRMGIAVNTVLPLAFHARLSDLVTTLRRARLPGLLKLPLLITVRFVPTFLGDVVQIREAVKLRFRGRGGIRFWVARPLLWWRVFFMPLVVRLIRSADELALAAELKGLSPETDFGSAPLVWSKADRTALALALLFFSQSLLAWSLYHA
ncbi:MAG: energy-coupling factor transporter transmembrane protein EcfT [Deltaproteobacteria bacterium]|nr:energy-coupling factor transporter transmembrane protein EcfT [Deltaproteobacteria bacterium]